MWVSGGKSVPGKKRNQCKGPETVCSMKQKGSPGWLQHSESGEEL